MRLAPDWLAPNALILLEIEATRGIQAGYANSPIANTPLFFNKSRRLISSNIF